MRSEHEVVRRRVLRVAYYRRVSTGQAAGRPPVAGARRCVAERSTAAGRSGCPDRRAPAAKRQALRFGLPAHQAEPRKGPAPCRRRGWGARQTELPCHRRAGAAASLAAPVAAADRVRPSA